MSSKKVDVTYLAVRQQLAAMNCEKYEIGLFHREKDNMIPRVYSAAEVLNAVPWLKAENCKGREIFIKPLQAAGLIFFDDVNAATLNKMDQDGLSPAIVIQSSPHNFHGWIRVSESPMNKELARACAKLIAWRYNGDLNSVDHNHFGRLAGFSNRKPHHVNESGFQPWVKLASRIGRLAPAGDIILAKGVNFLKKEAEKIKNRPTPTQTNNDHENGCKVYRAELANCQAMYPGHRYNASIVDWTIANKLAYQGFTREAVELVLELESPDLIKRKGNHTADYIKRTLDKIF